ncbi:MAG: serine/threonine protein kinase [Phycisphaerales bacterium]|nr:MAG: serine/threonine protein kinase [Phycisphaerales bacterium]
MDTEPKDIEGIFSTALQKRSAEERASYLDIACGDNAGLRARVEALLKAHEEAGSFLSAPVLDPTALDSDSLVPSEEPGTIIGRYKLLQLIGEGGFGSVYMAEQQQPVYRKVALKIIKLGMDTKQVIARFEAERQALALMDHPNIATVLDAGATKAGRPYFVMELVKGVPITEYCDTNGLPTGERLDLFLSVCNAIQHAHQKGIIHRDIKPSNVMVSLHDGKPVPKVIDFGIAKATHRRLTEKTFFTEFRQFVGTPEYMSPEQAEMSGLDIDTRSDVYSLGVLLYELLTGTTPFDSRALREAAYAEIQRIIREEEPPKPSTRFSSLGGASTAIAKNHQSDPRSLQRELRGDLDWITMKCLHKDRSSRYVGAAELAADILRHLNHEPVLAGPPGMAYQLRKFARRNRRLVGSLAAVVLALAAGVVVSTWFAVQATRAKEEAQGQAAIAQEVSDFLNNDLLASAAPASAPGREVTVREVLDKASHAIEDKFADDPVVEASIRTTLGLVYRNLGDYDEAEGHLGRALSLRREVLGKEHADTVYSLANLGSLYRDMGRYDEAEPLLVNALNLHRTFLDHQDPRMLSSVSGLAVLYAEQQRYEEAEPLQEQALELGRLLLGDEHPETLASMTNLALLYRDQRRFDEAEELLVKAVELSHRTLGEGHPRTLFSMNSLALLYRNLGRYDEAEPLLAQGLELGARVFGEEHPKMLIQMHNLGGIYRKLGRYEEAEQLYLRSLQATRRVLGDEHPQTLGFMNNLATLYCDLGRYEEAEPLYTRALELRRRVLGERHRATLASLSGLGRLYESQEQYEKADPLYAAAVAGARSSTPGGHWHLGVHLSRYGRMATKLERYGEAEDALFESYGVLESALGAENERTIETVQYIVDLYEGWGKPDKAAEWRQKLPPESLREEDPPSPDTSNEAGD